MENFTLHTRTKIIFGTGTENLVGEECVLWSKKILLHYGSGSIKKSGLYDRVTASLKKAGVQYSELGGVVPNPRLSLVKEGIEICRKQGIDFILAIGGGSVIDSAKAIAVGVPYSGNVWDFFMGIAVPQKALNVATVLTIPAAGSESSPSSVITNEDGGWKKGLTNELIRPVFSIMNPELTWTLPAFQTACGAADIMAHIMERYFTNTKDVDFTDRLCEAGLKTVIRNAPLAIGEPTDADARSQMMWVGSVAHNDLFGTGREGDWASHGIEHEISGIYDIAHGAGLAIIFPAWMKFVYKHDITRFAQFAVRVWDVDMDYSHPERTAFAGIHRLEKFLISLGLPVRFSDMKIDGGRFGEMASKCTGNGKWTVGNFVKLNQKDVEAIYNLAQ